MAAFLMNNDALSFVVLCLATRDTFPSPLPVPVAIAGGALLIAAGLGVKLWAASALGPAAYYWGNFFRDEPAVAPSLTGPYRWLDNPMYTVGYLHAYGFALATQSVPGLFAAVFDQAAILAFHYLVERPHFALLMKQAPGQSR
ncbi:MAG: hypothetical protein HOP28_18535 [Gemmatimonadales bacterium]|nr:hypothetical protein [Gemmatimonadales bacterium]